jgi:peroxiredoxin
VEFQELGVAVVGIGYSTPAENLAWAESLDYEFEVWSDADKVLATYYQAVVEWDPAPLRHAYILGTEGEALVKHEGAVSLGADQEAVLADCRVLVGG